MSYQESRKINKLQTLTNALKANITRRKQAKKSRVLDRTPIEDVIEDATETDRIKDRK